MFLIIIMSVCRYFFPSNVAINMDKNGDDDDQIFHHKEDFSAIMEVLINDTDYSTLF